VGSPPSEGSFLSKTVRVHDLSSLIIPRLSFPSFPLDLPPPCFCKFRRVPRRPIRPIRIYLSIFLKMPSLTSDDEAVFPPSSIHACVPFFPVPDGLLNAFLAGSRNRLRSCVCRFCHKLFFPLEVLLRPSLTFPDYLFPSPLSLFFPHEGRASARHSPPLAQGRRGFFPFFYLPRPFLSPCPSARAHELTMVGFWRLR